MAKSSKKIIKPAISKKDNRKIAFVVMPYGEYFDKYYKKIYCKAIEKVGLRPLRLDDSKTPVPLIQDIYDNITKAKVILVDLTEDKPNVYYELGLAHGINTPTILIRNTTEKIPFDINPFRIITYDKNNPTWGEDLKKDIISSLSEVSKKPKNFLPERLLKSSKDSGKTIQEEGDKELEEEIGSLQEQLLLEKERIMRREMTLRNELTHLPLHSKPSKRIQPFEAKMLVENYVKHGEPPSYIVSRLTELGAPRDWVEDQIKILNRRK